MMTREEAIEELERLLRHWDDLENGKRCFWGYDEEAVAVAFSALRPVSREQVEKSWAGCEYCEKHKINLVRIEMNYNDSPGSPKRLNPTRVPKFCPMCGRPLTDEAVQMVMERINEMEETTDEH